MWIDSCRRKLQSSLLPAGQREDSGENSRVWCSESVSKARAVSSAKSGNQFTPTAPGSWRHTGSTHAL